MPGLILSSDDNNDLHVWDLLNFGRPKLVASAHFDQTKYDNLAQLQVIHRDADPHLVL
jgi:hypothetical protein